MHEIPVIDLFLQDSKEYGSSGRIISRNTQYTPLSLLVKVRLSSKHPEGTSNLILTMVS